MQATLKEPTTAERWNGRAPLRTLAEKLGCSYDHLWRLYRRGLLRCIKTANGLESTEQQVVDAWARRAADAVDQAPEPSRSGNKLTAQERADRAAEAAFGPGVKAGNGE